MLTTFLYSLAGGMLAVLATGTPSAMARRFLRLACFFVLAAAAVLSVEFLRFGDAGSIGMVAGTLGVFLTVSAVAAVLTAPGEDGSGRAFQAVCAFGGLAGVAAACASALELPGVDHGSHLASALVVVSQAFGAMLLGSITIAWLLGHAYLTATKMTIAPLIHFSRMLSLTVLARTMFAIVSFAVAWLARGESGTTVLSQLGNVWLVVSIRVGFGLIVVGAMAYMVADCVRLRSTQSATGILYFASILAYVGELANQQLVVECGWPL